MSKILCGCTEDMVRAEPKSHHQLGLSEMTDRIAPMGTTEGTDLEFQLVGHIPCHSTEAGIGTAT
ncbi:MAG: hypothetical protein VYE18_00895 [Pseudomonadota bacterium]|nr:hypothetical protein [Pseudomonadota bacterium]